jgi:hypothetical protein
MKIKVKLQRPGYPCLDKQVVYVTIEDPEITALENTGYYITEVTKE